MRSLQTLFTVLSDGRRYSAVFVALGLILWLQGCNDTEATSEKSSVVIYCSVDTAFAEPILAAFEKRSGIKVHAIFDTEAGKTTGLINRLMAERARPRADVWWSSEVFGTIQLAQRGVLAKYESAAATDIPSSFRDPDNRWIAVGLRGRVIAYDPKRIKNEELPRSWSGLADPKYRGRFQMADPRFGTTRGHMAVLLSLWGQSDMEKFYQALRANECKLADGNAKAVLNLTRGLADFVATDTDDVLLAQARGDAIEMIHPDLDAPDGRLRTSGTLWIPCSVGLVKDSPNPGEGGRLIDYLISAEVEELLFNSESHNVPVRPPLREKLKTEAPHQASVDYAAAAKLLDLSDNLVRDMLLQ
jgi:iron(III) transport system substrate-binding protein